MPQASVPLDEGEVHSANQAREDGADGQPSTHQSLKVIPQGRRCVVEHVTYTAVSVGG